jgi:hypothetical protein
MRPRVRVCLCVLSHCAQVSEGVSSCERAIARVAGALRGRERAEGERELNAPSRAGRGGAGAALCEGRRERGVRGHEDERADARGAAAGRAPTVQVSS